MDRLHLIRSVCRNFCPNATGIGDYQQRQTTNVHFRGQLDKTPYWDWTSADSLTNGIPNTYSDANYQDMSSTLPNPLFAGPIENRARMTSRGILHDLNRLQSIAQSARLAMAAQGYVTFNSDIEGPHGSLHAWVAGDMGSVPRAAYDPIFWSHYANIDRQWSEWQRGPLGEDPDPSMQTQQIPGLPGWVVADTLDHTNHKLNYTYTHLNAIPIMRLIPDDSRNTITFSPSELMLQKKPRIVIEIEDIDRRSKSFMIDIFISDSQDQSTSGRSFGSLAGSFGIFGLEQHKHNGHGTANRTSKQRVDITDTVERLNLQDKNIRIQLVAITPEGDQIPTGRLPIGGISVSKVFL